MWTTSLTKWWASCWRVPRGRTKEEWTWSPSTSRCSNGVLYQFTVNLFPILRVLIILSNSCACMRLLVNQLAYTCTVHVVYHILAIACIGYKEANLLENSEHITAWVTNSPGLPVHVRCLTCITFYFLGFFVTRSLLVAPLPCSTPCHSIQICICIAYTTPTRRICTHISSATVVTPRGSRGVCNDCSGGYTGAYPPSLVIAFKSDFPLV